MAVTNAMYLFEVVLESVKSLVESRHLIIRCEFADIFSLELKDPKQLHIVMPEPLPLPAEPKGKKKKKPPKPKKGKKGTVEEPPPEPVIQSGQSVLFTTSAEFLIQNMKKYPMEVSLWSKEDNLVFIGSNNIPWDDIFLKFLQKVSNCQEPAPVTLKEEYNVFEEGTAKLMAKIGLQIKLTFLNDKITTAFRTLSEDPAVNKYLYTGINSKTTSYICTMKTTDEDFEKQYNKIDNNFVKDKPELRKIVYADYKNSPSTKLPFFKEGEICCLGNVDKPPESIYKAPETCPDIDFIVDYVRKIIVSCNDNMRMLTPRPIIEPRVKATDIDRLCYCKETSWPNSKLAERFKKEVQSGPCSICINAGKTTKDSHGTRFDISNIRGPCGRADCRLARDLRAYIENLVNEDNKEFDINEVIGPCGSKSCNVAEKIQMFLRHEGIFNQGSTLDGLSTQCACVKQMQQSLTQQDSCSSVCSKDCDNSDGEGTQCDGKGCPFSKQLPIYDVYYFTVKYDDDIKSGPNSTPPSAKSSKFKYCSTDCPSRKASEIIFCSKSTCTNLANTTEEKKGPENIKCQEFSCTSTFPPSPNDSDLIIHFNDIHSRCCVKTCDVAEKVKDFIADSAITKKDQADDCYCDCVCDFKFSKKTTYCGVCGGYECLGDDMRDQPIYAKPHPCPIYHKIYDKKYINVQSPFPEEEEKVKQNLDNVSTKSSKITASRMGGLSNNRNLTYNHSAITNDLTDRKSDKKVTGEEKNKILKKEKKKVGKFTANVVREPPPVIEKKTKKLKRRKYSYPPVPKNKGWNWTAEDVPGMKPRPKWKPGAANKILVRRYRTVRQGIDIIAKKKRAMMQRKKKTEMKPTLVVKKINGEYTVQMEVFKKYSKERLLFQYPYEEKPPIIYTIGKTEEEKQRIQKQRERRERRETRRKSRLLQSTFRDKCQEICLKAYNQAIGLLPVPNPNDPACPCYTEPTNVSPPIDSCSCSEEGSITSSDTDGDEWTIEFTPPAARWDVKAKHPPVLVENDSQYNYLDYKVKLPDKYGYPVPRFFKGPDGKQECSDLGGFWGPGHVWMEINKDGYIGPDNRWVPMNFLGPDGMFYSAEGGSFINNNGQVLKIGIDGYIDKDGKWAWYSKKKGLRDGKSKSIMSGFTVDTKKMGKSVKLEHTTKSKPNSKDKKNPGNTTPVKLKSAKNDALSSAKSDEYKVNKTVSYLSGKAKSPFIKNVLANYNKNQFLKEPLKKQMGPNKTAKYREIIKGLQKYEDLGEFRAPIKTNRASNTSRNKLSSEIKRQ